MVLKHDENMQEWKTKFASAKTLQGDASPPARLPRLWLRYVLYLRRIYERRNIVV